MTRESPGDSHDFCPRKKKAEVVEPAVISEELLIEGVEALRGGPNKVIFREKMGDLP